MAKKSSVENNERRRKLVKKFAGRRARLLAIANDDNQPMDERFLARLKLAELPKPQTKKGGVHPRLLDKQNALGESLRTIGQKVPAAIG